MSWWPRAWRWRDLDRQLDTELHDHIERLTADYVAAGMPETDARRRARLEFGGVEPIKEASRDTRPLRWVEDLRQDVHYAARSLARYPGFTAVAVLTFAVGIGVNTAIFSVVNAVLLKELPFPDADRLVHIFESYTGPRGGTLRLPLPAEDLRVLRSASRTLSDVDAYGSLVELRLGRDEDVDLRGARVSRSTLSALGARAVLGRLYDAQESADMDPVLVLSEATWRVHFGADPGIIGRPVIVEGSFPPPYGEPREVFTIIGVMSPGFPFPSGQTSFWIPLNLERAGGLGSIARLRDGVAPAVAAAEIASIFGDGRPGSSFEVIRLRDEQSAAIRPALTVLMVAVGLVLLIACANLANLLLARTMSRQQELAVRSALGGRRGRIVRQILTENLLLAGLGGAAGVTLAAAGIGPLQQLVAGLASRPDVVQIGRDAGAAGGFAALPLLEPALDVPTLLYTAAICLVAGLISGTAPALLPPRRSSPSALHGGAAAPLASFGLFRRHAYRSMLVIAQVAVAVALLVSGGLLIHGFVRLLTTDTGYDANSVLTFNVRLPAGRSSPNDVAVFANRLVTRLEGMAGIQSAGYTIALPTVGLSFNTTIRLSPNEEVPRRTPGSPYTLQHPGLLMASPGYSKAIGMRLVAGQHLDDLERAGGRRALLVNETLARGRFPQGNAVGQLVYLGSEPWEIAGVVADVWQGLEERPGPQVLTDFPTATDPFLRAVGTRYYYAVRALGPPTAILPAVREAIRQIDGEAMLDNVTTLDDMLASSLARPRLYATLLGLFAAVAVVLAAIGIYGVMAYAVAHNTREIGLRMALGAERREVLGLVLRRAGTLTAAGLAIGLLLAASLSRYLTGMIFGLTPLDAPTYVATAAVFALVAMAASYVPARRAARVDPMVALRAE